MNELEEGELVLSPQVRVRTKITKIRLSDCKFIGHGFEGELKLKSSEV
jgi:hypothetical protein